MSRTPIPPGLVLGSAQWGQPYGLANQRGVPDDAALRRMVVRAATAGVSGLDTARDYGRAEARIGRLARAGLLPPGTGRRGEPAGLEITTKLSAQLAAGGPGELLARTEASLDASRHALGVERIDVLLLHRPAHLALLEGPAWQRLREDREQGAIGDLGVSVVSPDEAWRLLDHPEIEVVQVPAGLLDQRLARAGFFERAGRRGTRIQVRSVFLQGALLLEPDRLPAALAPAAPAIERVRRFARGRGVSVLELCLAHARRQLRGCPGARVVVGCESSEQLDAILDAWRSQLAYDPGLDELAASLPALPDAVLDPWRWPRRAEAGRGAAGLGPIGRWWPRVGTPAR